MTARNLSSTELLVEWLPLPKQYIHGVLLGYRLNFTRDTTNLTEVISIPPNVTSHHVSGLMMYTCYVINIAGVNEIGVGVPSHDVIAWTDEGGKLFIHIFIVNEC